MSHVTVFGHAQWIWYTDPRHDNLNVRMQARRTFDLDAVPTKAPVRITADTRYRLYVNGEHVCRGPARGFQQSWPYDTVDISPFLRKGPNAVAVMVQSLGTSTFQYLHEGYASLILCGKAGKVDLATGEKWKVRRASAYRSVRTRVSIQLGFQEHFDARLDDGTWTLPEFDDRDWTTPQSQRVAGAMPWHDFEERGIPMLAEKPMAPVRLLSRASGALGDNCLGAEDVVSLFVAEPKDWRVSDTPLSSSGDFGQFHVLPPGRDKYDAYCLDFGKEVVGSICLEVDGGTGGEIIDCLIAEGIEDNAPVIRGPGKHNCFAAFGNRLILRSGLTRHEQFDHWGFRFLVIVVRRATTRLSIKAGLRWVGYPLDVRGRFDSSDERLNRIYAASVWTQQCCTLDAYVDCPWREQAQWWGDARIHAFNTFYLSADHRVFRRGIRQIGTQETPNGLSYGHAPTSAHNCILPDFTLTWLLTHRDYYWQTGDLSLFLEMTDRVHRALKYFEQMTGSNGLLPYDDRYWLFLDWCPIFKEGYPTVYNIFYVWALEAVSSLFARIGDRKAAKRYSEREKAVRRAVERRLFDTREACFRGGLDWKGKTVEQTSAHIYALAVLSDLIPDRHEDFARRILLPLVYGEFGDPLTPSPFFMFYIFEALKKLGHNAAVLDCIRRWWGSMLDRGLSTTEERWNAMADSGSLCHAWSAHPIVHLSNILLGVRQTGLAWKTIRFEPSLTGVDRVSGRVATPLGDIDSGWERRGASTDVFLRLPRGLKAEIVLPGISKRGFTGTGKWTVPTRKG